MLLKRWKIDGEFIFWKRVRKVFVFITRYGSMENILSKGPNILPLGTFLLDLFILAKDGLFIQFDVFLKLKASPYWHKEGCLLSGVPASNALATGPKFIIKGCLAW
ncbi:hypothetical protein Tco_1099898 [Tanacetum coccineum]